MPIDARDLTILAAIVLAFAVASGSLVRGFVTPAIAFLAMGMLVGEAGLGLLNLDVGGSGMRLVAETTLAFVLFVDASHISLRALRRELWIPARLLAIGLPLAILANVALAMAILPSLALAEAAILAVAVAPTDAALGQAVVSDERVPRPVRQGLNVESGLNDGLCVPLLVLALGAAGGQSGEAAGPVALILEEVGRGVVLGVAAGAVAAVAFHWSSARGGFGSGWRGAVPIAATGVAYGAATLTGGSGLIAAFAGGLTFGVVLRRIAERRSQVGLVGNGDRRGRDAEEVAETVANILSGITFAAFGAAVLPGVLGSLDWRAVVFALAVLTVGRILPVAFALAGSGASPVTVLFAGWFGPRGLASIVFAVIILQAGIGPAAEVVLEAIVMTVTFSIILHGLTARPLTQRYAAWLASNGPSMQPRQMEL